MRKTMFNGIGIGIGIGIGMVAAFGLLSFGTVANAAASLEIDPSTTCTDLIAGQSIDAGDVCFSINGDQLLVTYAMQNGWELTEAHLWAGNTVDGYPQTKKGNPKIGNFPFNSGDITGSNFYSFSMPISDISTLNLANIEQYCPDGISENLYALAHAAVRKEDGSGGYQTETGWADGDKVVDRGSWATSHMFTLNVICDQEPPPPPPERGQETAIMFGDIVLNQMTQCGDQTPQRWGWQDGPLFEGTHTQPIWAAAGLNDTTKGTHIGDVTMTITSGQVAVDVSLFEGFAALETHIYVGLAPTCSAAFGKDWRSSPVTSINTDNGVYVGVHLSSEGDCQDNGNFCN